MDIVPQKSIETLDPSNVANIDDTNGNESQRGSKDSFDPPSMTTGTRLAIEFCNRCRWLHRANWMATELMLTFPPPTLLSISLVPLDAAETSGRFRVWLFLQDRNVLLWDRKAENGFPELKILKQRLRDVVDPGRNLGHSDIQSK